MAGRSFLLRENIVSSPLRLRGDEGGLWKFLDMDAINDSPLCQKKAFPGSCSGSADKGNTPVQEIRIDHWQAVTNPFRVQRPGWIEWKVQWEDFAPPGR